MATVFTGISNVFTELGTGDALIRKKIQPMILLVVFLAKYKPRISCLFGLSSNSF